MPGCLTMQQLEAPDGTHTHTQTDCMKAPHPAHTHCKPAGRALKTNDHHAADAAMLLYSACSLPACHHAASCHVSCRCPPSCGHCPSASPRQRRWPMECRTHLLSTRPPLLGERCAPMLCAVYPAVDTALAVFAVAFCQKYIQGRHCEVRGVHLCSAQCTLLSMVHLQCLLSPSEHIQDRSCEVGSVHLCSAPCCLLWLVHWQCLVCPVHVTEALAWMGGCESAASSQSVP